MGPEEYEHHIAALLRSEGWTTSVTNKSRDLGIDVFAEREGHRLGVQAKKYGGTATRVNAEQIMCLYGAAAYADCTEQMLATDGALTPDALRVSAKLEVEIRHIVAERLDGRMQGPRGSGDAWTFAAVWEKHIRPLAGTTLERGPDKVLQILEVDASGVRRITTGNTRQHIAIETFRWAIDRLLAGETVTRSEIHERDHRQVSSGIVLILSTVPFFDLIKVGRQKALRMRVAAGGE